MTIYKSHKKDKKIKRNDSVLRSSFEKTTEKQEDLDVIELRKVLKQISRDFLSE